MFVYVRHLSRFRVWDTAGLSRGLSAFVKPVKILMHKYFGFCRLDSDGCHFKDIQLQAKRDAIILCVCLCVCVCLREREREREGMCLCGSDDKQYCLSTSAAYRWRSIWYVKLEEFIGWYRFKNGMVIIRGCLHRGREASFECAALKVLDSLKRLLKHGGSA